MAFKMKTPYNFFGNLTGGLASNLASRKTDKPAEIFNKTQNPQANQPFIPGGKQPPLTQPPLTQPPIAQSPLTHAGHGKGVGMGHHQRRGEHMEYGYTVEGDKGTKLRRKETRLSKAKRKQYVKRAGYGGKAGLFGEARKSKVERLQRKVDAESHRNWKAGIKEKNENKPPRRRNIGREIF